jgi:hypothetical protein
LAAWDQDGSALTDLIDQNDTCPESEINDDPDGLAQLERMRRLSEPEVMDDSGP